MICRPHMRNPRAALGYADNRMHELQARGPVTIQISFMVDTLGKAEPPFTFSPSFGEEVDEILEESVREMEFYPATIEHRPIRTLVTLPYVFR